MDRELLGLILAAMACGPALFFGSAAVGSPRPESETAAWRRLLMPLLPAAMVIVALGGWALGEPEEAEAAGASSVGFACVIAAMWVRAIVRGVRTMRDAKQHQGLAKTVGLFRPVVLIEDGLRDALDDEALRAVELHECAHARHRDPLRLWLAQLVTDLQWPSPAAPRRLSAWLDELELARDDDAIASGADPAALAHAIVTCAKLQGAGADDLRPAATLTRGANLLRRRVRRLLDEPARPGPQGEGRTRSRLPIVLVSALVASAVLGAVYGESVVRTLTLRLG